MCIYKRVFKDVLCLKRKNAVAARSLGGRRPAAAMLLLGCAQHSLDPGSTPLKDATAHKGYWVRVAEACGTCGTPSSFTS